MNASLVKNISFWFAPKVFKFIYVKVKQRLGFANLYIAEVQGDGRKDGYKLNTWNNPL